VLVMMSKEQVAANPAKAAYDHDKIEAPPQ
jgi:hypothetical protein